MVQVNALLRIAEASDPEELGAHGLALTKANPIDDQDWIAPCDYGSIENAPEGMKQL